MINRLIVLSAILLATTSYVVYAMEPEKVPLRESLQALPLQVQPWQGRNEPAFEDDILEQLGVDEYVLRTYVSASQPWVGLYAGFYESQRQGDTMHSPLNCLPGAGWLPIKQDRATFDVVNAAGVTQQITVNEFVIEKGLDRQVVLYWYQSHGRVVASEYTSKLYMIGDAMRLNRTDGAMVRVITPIAGPDRTAEIAAKARAQQFVQGLFPALSRVLPS